jgi:hypothetical protein
MGDCAIAGEANSNSAMPNNIVLVFPIRPSSDTTRRCPSQTIVIGSPFGTGMLSTITPQGACQTWQGETTSVCVDLTAPRAISTQHSVINLTRDKTHDMALMASSVAAAAPTQSARGCPVYVIGPANRRGRVDLRPDREMANCAADLHDLAVLEMGRHDSPLSRLRKLAKTL